jgi:preprotein translocase subunit SecE
VARNRKRAKERRNRRPQSADARVAVARGSREEHATAPPPIEHATPDVELAEAQLALGRPELAGDQSPAEIEALTEAEEQEEELQDYAGGSGIPGMFPGQPQVVSAADELEEDEYDEEAGGGGRGGRRGRRASGDGGLGGGDSGGGGGGLAPAGGDSGGGGGGLAPVTASVPEHRSFPGSRLVNFLRGSWRELQRVQWPDRRQVVQATGVVIGFVIVAGLFLGGADWVAGKIVTFVLK